MRLNTAAFLDPEEVKNIETLRAKLFSQNVQLWPDEAHYYHLCEENGSGSVDGEAETSFLVAKGAILKGAKFSFVVNS
uniref:Uncharacterized protein n=1 Tax=Sphaerodactylus townsendi TaxID=933632 RepID=A0ACB8FGB0_9SAUR